MPAALYQEPDSSTEAQLLGQNKSLPAALRIPVLLKLRRTQSAGHVLTHDQAHADQSFISKCLKSGSREYGEQLEQWFRAACTGNIETIKSLIGTVNINAQYDYGNTALLYAAQYGHSDLVSYLLQVPGIDVNMKNQYSWTAIMQAIDSGHENVVKILLQCAQVNINSQNAYGATPLIIAIQARQANILKILLQHPKINLNIQNTAGDTALIEAVNIPAEIVDISMVKLLLEVPSLKINMQNHSGYTAYDCAKQRHHHIIAQLIKDKITQLTKKAFDAIKHDDSKIVKAIINQLGNNIFDQTGKSLLQAAFISRAKNVITYLLQNARDPRELLATFPFDLISPSTELFEYFINLAYGTHVSQLPETSKDKLNCHMCGKETTLFCGACKKIYYCSADCQKAHWIKHKTTCKKIHH